MVDDSGPCLNWQIAEERERKKEKERERERERKREIAEDCFRLSKLKGCVGTTGLAYRGRWQAHGLGWPIVVDGRPTGWAGLSW